MFPYPNDVLLTIAGGLTCVIMVLWATGKLPHYLTALLFLVVAAVLRLVPSSIVFSGFESSAFWLVFSGFVLGAAIRKVGLADRVARRLLRHLSGSWPKMVFGTVFASYLLAFVMPSTMGRIALLMPIILALADQVGLKEGSSGRIGLVLGAGLGTYELASTILPSNVPNLVLMGAAENILSVHFAYLPYLMLHAPILGVVKGFVLASLVCILFPAKPHHVAEVEPSSPVRPEEWRLIIILLVTLVLWSTDAVHGVNPAWVGLGAACLCLLPRIGFLFDDEFADSVNMRTCIYIAGIIGLSAFVEQTGLGRIVGDCLVRVLPFDGAEPFKNFSSLLAIATSMNFVVTSLGVPALYTPIAHALSNASSLSVATVLMVQVIAYATPMLPYQAAPVVVAMSMGNVPQKAAIRLCLPVAVITLVVLAPIDYFWFRILGLID